MSILWGVSEVTLDAKVSAIDLATSISEVTLGMSIQETLEFIAESTMLPHALYFNNGSPAYLPNGSIGVANAIVSDEFTIEAL